jgi:ribosomal protein S18 acetylase RimI-like enzyme
MRYCRATERDVEAIAALHAESWRRNYRGAFADEFLDGDVVADRLAVWTDRLARPGPNDHTIVAERDGVIVGFAHTVFDDDPTWGALLDNLHVGHDLKCQGIGTQLMVATALAVIERTPSSGLYLWVLEQNQAARAFYEARGGNCVGRERSEPPGGGTVVGLRYAWPEPSALLTGLPARRRASRTRPRGPKVASRRLRPA